MPERKEDAISSDIGVCAIPVLAQAIAIAIGNEPVSVAISIATAAAYLRMRWDAGVIVASGAAGLIIAASLFSPPYAAANTAANAAFWMICAGVAALALGEMKVGRGSGGGIAGKKAAPYRTSAS